MPTQSARPRSTARTAPGALRATALLAAPPPPPCSPAARPGTATAGSGDATRRQDAAASGYPLTIDNCGTEVTFEAAPERVVTIKSSTLELLLALGLEDRIVGAAFTDGPVPDEYADAASGIEVLSDKVPSQEVTLAAEPDLVFAGWESNLSAEGAGDRDTLAKLGVAHLRRAGGVQGRGLHAEPAHVRRGLPRVRGGRRRSSTCRMPRPTWWRPSAPRSTRSSRATRGLTALWYSSGDDTPYVGAGIGAPQMIMDAAGLENIAADVEDTWTSMGWEAIVAADPDVIVLVDARVEHRGAEDRPPRVEPRDGRAARGAAAAVPRRGLPGHRGGRAQRRRGRVARRPARGARAAMSATRAGAARRRLGLCGDGRHVGSGDGCRTAACAGAARPHRPAHRRVGRGPRRCCSWHPSSSPSTIGPAGLSPADVWASVLAHLGIGEPTLSPLRDGIVWELRMPRVLTAAAVGAGLALCGVVMQALTRNPLADPYLLGLSSGASVGAVVVIVLGVGLLLPVAAFAGALVALVATLALANAAGRAHPDAHRARGTRRLRGLRRDHEPRHLLERDGRQLPRDPQLAARLARRRRLGVGRARGRRGRGHRRAAARERPHARRLRVRGHRRGRPRRARRPQPGAGCSSAPRCSRARWWR